MKCVFCAVCTDGMEERLSEILPRLSPARQTRIAAQTRMEDRLRSAAAELSYLIACRIAGIDAGYLRGENGRPCREDTWDLSLTHAGAYGAAAVAESAVGIDMEKCDRDFSRVLRRITAPQETSVLPVQLWTAKEAYLKLTGEGVGFPMHRLTLTEHTLLRDGTADAQIVRLPGPAGYETALAARETLVIEAHLLRMEEALERIEYDRKESHT